MPLTLISEQPNYTSKDVLIFLPIGDFITEMRPMLISTKKINLPLSEMDIYRLRLGNVNINNLSKEKIDEITSMEYVKVVTDKFTFSTIEEFISRRSQYYLNEQTRRIMPRGNSFVVIYNGVNDTVYYKLADKFLLNLQQYLIFSLSDPSAARKISDFKYDSSPH